MMDKQRANCSIIFLLLKQVLKTFMVSRSLWLTDTKLHGSQPEHSFFLFLFLFLFFRFSFFERRGSSNLFLALNFMPYLF